MPVGTIDPTNAEQARAWDGDEGEFWAANADAFDRAVADYHQRFLDTAAVRPADRVLDIGCGNGQTTFDAAALACDGSAVGIDLSTAMIERARERAHRLRVGNVAFVVGDAQVHPFEAASYDVAISRTGAMFFGDQLAAFTNIARSLRPAGRLVLLAWQPPAKNGFVTLTQALAAGRTLPLPPLSAPGPFGRSDAETVTSTLQRAGFRDVVFEAVAGSMWFGDTPASAYEFTLGLLGWMLEGLTADQRDAATESLRQTLAAHATPAGVRLETGAWLITAARS
jgi:SAM-dependent methyltransferase